MTTYETQAKLFKVLSDPNRLKILEILSCGERCACEIQAYFNFSQPTLSHHMKILVESGLVTSRKEGLWQYYNLNREKAQGMTDSLTTLLSDTPDCPCNDIPDREICQLKVSE